MDLNSIIRKSIRNILTEGATFTKQENGTYNLNINSDATDKENSGGNDYVDTRIFGKRGDILYGDGTANGHTNNLSDTVLSRRAIVTAYNNLIEYVRNGRRGVIFTDKNIPQKTVSTINKALESNMSDAELIELAKRNAAYNTDKSLQKSSLYDRVVNDTSGKNIMRYTKFIIPNTNIECIALFSMGSFNLSDAIKNGKLRSSNNLIDGEGEVNVTYDNLNRAPNIQQNFSLSNVNADHFKTQYQLQGAKYDTSVNTQDDYNRELSKEKNYTSVNQFLDKSIIYAANVLNKENYIPDVIVTVPSSSRMNHYYATNLSNKMNVRYIPDFFSRNVINAKLRDGITDEDLINDGMSQFDIEQIKVQIKNYAFREILFEINKPINELIDNNMQWFGNISNELHSREKADIEEVKRVLSKRIIKYLMNFINEDDAVTQHLANDCLSQTEYKKEDKHLWGQISFILKHKVGIKQFNKLLSNILNIIKMYSDKIINGGYSIRNYNVSKQSKIVSVDRQYRKYIEGSYIVADKNCNQNNELFKSLRNAKFLIVDEDVNSGGSFALTSEALKSKMLYSLSDKANTNDIDRNIVCLANGFSEKGR